MSPYSLTVYTLFFLATLLTVRTTASKKTAVREGCRKRSCHAPACGPTAINGLKESSELTSLTRDKTQASLQNDNGKLHLAFNIGELVKRSADETDGCGNTIIHQEAASSLPSVLSKKTVEIPRSNTSTETKKKATIGGITPDLKSIVNIIKEKNVTPLKHLTLPSEIGTKKTVEGKNSITSLIAAVKARENLTTKSLALGSNAASDSVKKGSVSDATTQVGEKKGLLDEKSKPTNNKIADAGKSILAAIDDKEGLRAALAKAIDRVEKVVANKNGILAPRKQDLEKKNETKPDLAANVTVRINSTVAATNATVSGEKTAVITNTTENGTSSALESTEKAPAVKAPEKDPYAEIAMGPDKPKIPELKGEESESPGGPVMKLGDQGVQRLVAPGGGGGVGGDGGVSGLADGKMQPLAGMHDVGGLLDSLTDKVNLADTKGFPSIPPSAGGIRDPAGLLDTAQEKLNTMESKGDSSVPGMQDPGGLLDRATEKFNRLGSGIATDSPPMDDSDVKYMQSQIRDGGEEEQPNSKMADKMSNRHMDDSVKPLEEPVKPMGADDAMKALTGDDISSPSQMYKNNDAIKTLEKDDTYNPMLKPTIGEPEEDNAMKGMKDDVEDDEDHESMHKMDEDSPHKGSDDGLVKDILDKASSMNGDSKGGGGDDTFKELQGADISAGPDPYGDKEGGGDSYNSMYGGGHSKNEDSYGDMPNEHEMGDGMQGFAQHSPSEESFGDPYDKSDYGSPREGVESNEEPQNQVRSRSRGAESLFSMGNDNEFTSRHNIPGAASFWSGSRIHSPNADSYTTDTFNDNYNTQMFKRNVIMRPERDYYVSPFNGKDSFEID